MVVVIQFDDIYNNMVIAIWSHCLDYIFWNKYISIPISSVTYFHQATVPNRGNNVVIIQFDDIYNNMVIAIWSHCLDYIFWNKYINIPIGHIMYLFQSTIPNRGYNVVVI